MLIWYILPLQQKFAQSAFLVRRWWFEMVETLPGLHGFVFHWVRTCSWFRKRPWNPENGIELIVHFDRNYLYSSKFNKTISFMSAGNVIFYKNTISDITKWRKYLTQIIFNDFWMNIWNVKNWLFWDLKLARNFTRMKFYQHKISYKK